MPGALDEDDRALRYQRGDVAGFEEIACRHQDRVFRLALVLLASREDARDATQEVSSGKEVYEKKGDRNGAVAERRRMMQAVDFDVGTVGLSDDEVRRLRDHLLRGVFPDLGREVL